MTLSCSFLTFEFCPYSESQRRSVMARQEKVTQSPEPRPSAQATRFNVPCALGHFCKRGIGTADEALNLVLTSGVLVERVRLVETRRDALCSVQGGSGRCSSAICVTTVHATDYLWRASSHCTRTSATADGDLARPQDLAQPKLAHWFESR